MAFYLADWGKFDDKKTFLVHTHGFFYRGTTRKNFLRPQKNKLLSMGKNFLAPKKDMSPKTFKKLWEITETKCTKKQREKRRQRVAVEIYEKQKKFFVDNKGKQLERGVIGFTLKTKISQKFFRLRRAENIGFERGEAFSPLPSLR